MIHTQRHENTSRKAFVNLRVLRGCRNDGDMRKIGGDPRIALLILFAAIFSLLTPFCLYAVSPSEDGIQRFPVVQRNSGVAAASRDLDQHEKVQIQKDYGRLPLYFIENRGQINEKVKFYEKGSGHAVFFTQEEVVFSFQKQNATLDADSDKEQAKLAHPKKERFRSIEAKENQSPTVMRLSALNSRKDVQVVGLHQQEAKVNYFIGKD